MMRNHIAKTLFRFFLIAFAAVCVTNANFFIPTATLDLGIGTAIMASCPQTMPAIARGPIAPNGPSIAAQCPEACPNWVAGEYQWYSQGYDGLDWITVRCSNGSYQPIYSTTHPGSTASTCWNCVDGCAGANCPPGELCVPIPRSSGSDCQRFACPAGYTLTESSATTAPYCTLTNPGDCDDETITVTLEGPTTIRTGQTCSWSASATGGKPGVAKTYTWYVSNNPVGWDQWYTGGRPSGTLVGYSWRLRVDVTDGVNYGSKEIQVSESSSAPPCFN